MSNEFYSKYLKYKSKYQTLKTQIGGFRFDSRYIKDTNIYFYIHEPDFNSELKSVFPNFVPINKYYSKEYSHPIYFIKITLSEAYKKEADHNYMITLMKEDKDQYMVPSMTDTSKTPKYKIISISELTPKEHSELKATHNHDHDDFFTELHNSVVWDKNHHDIKKA